MKHRVAQHVGIDFEIAAKSVAEGVGASYRQRDHQVNVVGRSWLALERAAKLPPRKYSAPTEVRALATLSAISIAFSPTLAGIELGAWEESGSDLAPVKAQGEARTHHFVRCVRRGGTDG